MAECPDPTDVKEITNAEVKRPSRHGYLSSLNAVIDPILQHLQIVRYCGRPSKQSELIKEKKITAVSAAKFLLFCFTITGFTGYLSGQTAPLVRALNTRLNTELFSTFNIPIIGTFLVFLFYVPIQAIQSRILHFLISENKIRDNGEVFIVLLINTGLFLFMSYATAAILTLWPNNYAALVAGYGLVGFNCVYPTIMIANIYKVRKRRVAGAYALFVVTVVFGLMFVVFARSLFYSNLYEEKLKVANSLETENEHSVSLPNVYLWGGALDTLSFMKFQSADLSAGLVITNWYAPPGVVGERFKASVMILDTIFKDNALQIKVDRQVLSNNHWKDVIFSSQSLAEITGKVLGRARELQMAGKLMTALPKYIRFDYLTRLRLPISTIDVVNRWSPAPRPGGTHVETLLPFQPSMMLQQLVRDRLLADGPNGRALCQIEDASFTQFSDHIEGSLAVGIDVGGSSTINSSHLTVHVGRSIKITDQIPTAVFIQTNKLLGDLLEDMNVELEFQTQSISRSPTKN